MTIAEAPPPPLQIVATPMAASRVVNTFIRRTMMAAPLAPIGCPIATAPPNILHLIDGQEKESAVSDLANPNLTI